MKELEEKLKKSCSWIDVIYNKLEHAADTIVFFYTISVFVWWILLMYLPLLLWPKTDENYFSQMVFVAHFVKVHSKTFQE